MNRERAKLVFMGATVCAFAALVGAFAFPILSWRRWFLLLAAICGLVVSLANVELGREEGEAPQTRKWLMVSRLYEMAFGSIFVILVLFLLFSA